MDVGGGEGVFLGEAAKRAPELGLVLFDLPAVAERARARLADAGLTGRAAIHGGDFLANPLPEGADLVTLIRIVHDHDDASALALLRNVRRALTESGTLLVVEAMSGVKGAEPLDASTASTPSPWGAANPEPSRRSARSCVRRVSRRSAS